MFRRQEITYIATGSLWALTSSSTVLAQDSVGLRFAQAFMGTCVQDFPDTTKIRAAAKALNWKEIVDPNLKAMMGPSDSSASWRGWLMVVDNDKYFVGVSEGVHEGRNVQTCTLVQDRTDVSGVIEQLEKLLGAKKLGESVEAGQRYGTWEFKKGDSSLLLMTVDGTPMNFDMITASITTDIRSN